MRVLLRVQAPQGFAERLIEVERVRIGRGTDQDVQLSDLRVALTHAELRRERGAWLVEASTPNGIWVNGVRVAGAVVDDGDEIDCGRFRLQLQTPPPDIDLLLEIRERATAAETRSGQRRSLKLRLEDLGISRRRLGWELGLLALLVGLALPLNVYFSEKGGHALRMWSPGKFSSAHHALSQDCQACHVRPFEPVPNAACLHCHKDIPAHRSSAELLRSTGHGVPACTSCHTEHEGSNGLNVAAGRCETCHAEPHALGIERLPAAADFGRAHPDFSPVLPQYRNGRIEWREIQENAAGWVQTSNLQFSHALHLRKGGLDSPGGRQSLACTDCHQPDHKGEGFEPIRFPTHCQNCHRLDFEPDAPKRVLPHADLAAAEAILLDFYNLRALRKGNSRSQAEARARATMNEVVELRVCGTCHVVSRGAKDAWVIAPVAPMRSMLDAATFSHRQHRSLKCLACHAAVHSKHSSDVLLPRIDTCRECHGADGLKTNCAQCHRYHQQSSAP
jgi:hypothetical protein